MSDQPVLLRVENTTGILTLNRPNALHALNMDMCKLIIEALLEWRKDDNIDQIMLEHASDTRGFCAGGDIKMLAASGASDGVEAAEFFREEYRLNTLIKTYPKPFIAILDGITMGGGVGISVHGKVRIATERTVFSMPESSIGLFPDVGGGWFLSRLQGETGTWLGLTGDRLKGQDVLAAGLATHFVSESDIKDVKAKLIAQGLGALEGVQTQADASYASNLDVLNACYGHDRMEDILAALESSELEWANTQADRLKTKCPLTLKVTLKLLRWGRANTSFEENMRTEYRISSRMVKTPDFLEGVRALLVDKDHNPKWSHAHVSEIADAEVDQYFEPLPGGELTLLEET